MNLEHHSRYVHPLFPFYSLKWESTQNKIMYNIAISFYLLAIKLAGLFNKKVKLMCQGHKQVFDILRQKRDKESSYLWFHAA